MISLLDTNVIVRFLTADRDPKYKGIYDFFKNLENGDTRAELRWIVLFQTVFVLKSFYKIPGRDIAQALLDLLEYKGISIKEKKKAHRTLRLWRDTGLDIVDCYLIAALEGDPQNILYSYDHDFDKFGIKREEP